jgi:hypothetical protein
MCELFAKWKNILGEPGKGVHKHYFGIAIMDVIFTIIGAYILHSIYPKYSFPLYLIVLFISGIILHRLFGVRTTVDKILFTNV